MIFAKWIIALILRLYDQLVVNILVVEEGFFELIVLKFLFFLFFDLSSTSCQGLIIKASLFEVFGFSEGTSGILF